MLKGIVKTNRNTYEITAKAKPCRKYIDEIESLYRVFQQNNIVWSTINCPYAYKFIDVVTDSEIGLADNETVSEIIIDFGEYESYRLINCVPLWNIKPVDAEDKSFPMPAKDRINYEHSISLADFGVQNGYLVARDNRDYLYTKRTENDLVVVTGGDRQQDWKLLQIENISNLKRRGTSFEMLSNKKDLGFAGKYAALKSLTVRTKGEVARLITSYEQSQTVSFESVEIVESYQKTVRTINYNSFIDDEIRIDSSKKIMLLRFDVFGGESYLAYDKISFFVSEIQVLFPEYKCIGEFSE